MQSVSTADEVYVKPRKKPLTMPFVGVNTNVRPPKKQRTEAAITVEHVKHDLVCRVLYWMQKHGNSLTYNQSSTKSYAQQLWLLKQYEKRTQGTDSMSITYFQHNTFGRMYCNESAQFLKRAVRNTLFHEQYNDIDMVNSQPTLLLQICKKQSWPHIYLEHYITNRNQCLADIQQQYKLTRDAAKQRYLEALNGGGGRLLREPDCPVTYKQFYTELKQIRCEMLRYAELTYPQVRARLEQSVPKNKSGSVLACVLQNEEHRCVSAMCSYVTGQGYEVGTVIFDGLLLRKCSQLDSDTDLSDLLRQCERYVLSSTGYTIKLLCKPMTDELLPIPAEFEPGVLKTYIDVKSDFELTHFKCQHQFYVLDQLSCWQARDRSQLLVMYENKYFVDIDGKRKHFIREWLQDSHMRCYDRVCSLPPPLDAVVGTFNTWQGIAAAQHRCELTSSTEADVAVLEQHVRNMCGTDKADDVYKWMQCWIAHMFQKPGKKPRVSLVLYSKAHGVGKGLLYRMLLTALGSSVCHMISDVKTYVAGSFNSLLDGAVLLAVDESNSENTKPAAELLKHYITETTMAVNGKYQSHRVVKSYVRWLFLTNNKYFMKVAPEDRRMMLVDVGDKLKDNFDYFERLNAAINNQDAIYHWYKMYMDMDIEGVNFETRPKTLLYKEVQQASIPLDLKFLQFWAAGKEGVIEVQANDMAAEYHAYIREVTGSSIDGSTLGKRLQRMDLPSTVFSKSRQNSGYRYTFDVNVLVSWLCKQGLDC